MFRIFIAVVSFGIVFCSINGIALLWRARARKSERSLIARVRQDSPPDRQSSTALLFSLSSDKAKLAKRIADRLQQVGRVRSLLDRAGEPPDPAPLLRACAISGVIPGAILLFVLSGPFVWLALLAIVLGSCLPVWRLGRKARKRMNSFEAQFPDGLEFIARSMRAGHAFSVSLEMLYQEFDQPMAGEFRRTFEEQNLGLPLEVALAKFAERVPLVDVKFFTSAVLLQRKTGGNLTEILDNLAYLIRERYKLRGKIRAVSAHGRMTGKALSSIPVFVGVLMLFMNRDYAVFFMKTTTGNEMIAACVALQIVGYLIIQRIVNIQI